MFRFPACALFVAAVFAQSPADLFQKAPPDVDEALRGRIREFYQDHVDGRFRQAEQLVAEDTKDFFYSSKKQKYLSFEINRIDYSEDFTKAKAVIIIETFLPIIGMAQKPIKAPVGSTWKIENGKWCWYVDQSDLMQTPFGTMKAGNGKAGPAPALPRGSELATLFSAVKADRSAVTLDSSPQQVTITNGMPGAITLLLTNAKIPGLEVSLDRASLKAGEKAIVTIREAEEEPLRAPVTLTYKVNPLGSVIVIEVKPKK